MSSPYLGNAIARALIGVIHGVRRVLGRVPRFSANPYFFWDLGRVGRHPRHYRGALGFLLEISNFWIIVLFIALHAMAALFFAHFIDVVQFTNTTAHGTITLWDRFYFSIINQISPGFTEYYPQRTETQALFVAQSFIGAIFNALLFALVVAKLFFPGDVFEIAPQVAFSPEKNAITIRLYSKYPGTLFDLEFSLYRFIVEKRKNGAEIGRTEQHPIFPTQRKILRKNYALLLNAPVVADDLPWETDTRGMVSNGIPHHWLFSDTRRTGHFYLVVSAHSSTGRVNQVANLPLLEGGLRCGEHQLLNQDVQLDMENWYDYPIYNWATWGKIDTIPCAGCTYLSCEKRALDET